MSAVRVTLEPSPETEVVMSGQLAFTTSEGVGSAAVWETLPWEVQHAIAVALARMLARRIEAERDE